MVARQYFFYVIDLGQTLNRDETTCIQLDVVTVMAAGVNNLPVAAKTLFLSCFQSLTIIGLQLTYFNISTTLPPGFNRLPTGFEASLEFTKVFLSKMPFTKIFDE